MGLLSAFFGLFSEKRRLQNAIDRITGEIKTIDKALAKGRGDLTTLRAKRVALVRERDTLRALLAGLED